MISSKRSGVFLMVPAVVLVLSGCALIEPADTSAPPTALEVCALGHTWQLDTADLTEKLLEELPKDDVPAQAVEPTGGQSLVWESNGAVTIDSDLELSITVEPKKDQEMIITQKYSGVVTGEALINVDVAIPRDWDVSDYTVTTSAELDGEPVEDLAYDVPRSDFNDVLGLVVTCESDVLTINPRGTDLIQQWTRAS